MGALERPVRVGTPEAALLAEPVVAGALHHTAAGGAGPGVLLPRLSGGHPDHLLAGGGGPGHQRVVGVGDHHGLGVLEALAPLLGHHPGLGGAVELVAGEVEQGDRLGAGVAGDTGQVLLVDLDHAEAGLRAAGQGGGDAGRHVGAQGVGDHRAGGAQRLGDQTGGGGLAVGGADQHHVQVVGEGGEQIGVEPERDLAADHRAAASAGLAGHGGGHLAGGHRDLRACRQRGVACACGLRFGACHAQWFLLAAAPPGGRTTGRRAAGTGSAYRLRRPARLPGPRAACCDAPGAAVREVLTRGRGGRCTDGPFAVGDAWAGCGGSAHAPGRAARGPPGPGPVRFLVRMW